MSRKNSDGRTVWRVLADPVGADGSFVESWHPKAHTAYLEARCLETKGFGGVEVNRCRLAKKVSRIALLNRRGFLDDSDVVPPETWRSESNHSKRATRGGKS